MYDINALLKQYDVWDTARDRAGARESTDHPVSPSTWADLDDEGTELAHMFAGLLRQETLCLICKEPIRLSWIHPRSNGNHGSIECGTGDGSIATASETPVVPLKVWTLALADEDQPAMHPLRVTVHPTEEACWEHLRDTYDPEGMADDEPPVAIVGHLENEGWVISIDVHEVTR